MSHLPPDHPLDLPDGWSVRSPGADDVARLLEIVRADDERGKGYTTSDPESIERDAIGIASWTRRHALVVDPQGVVQGWSTVHDRAAGRTRVLVTLAHDLPEADALAASLYAWGESFARQVGATRGLGTTRLDADAYAGDDRQRGWLEAAGYDHTRTWLHMSRPVAPDEATSLPGPRAGVTVRRVAKHDNGLPVAGDIQTVHQVLEESFEDHFNSYRESFPEFIARLREDTGHRWDHWWIATIEVDGVTVPAGAVVSTVLGPDREGHEGSYIDYIGVHRHARGMGVAKALLHTVIRDAAERGRNRVGLEVDADSPTGADGLYESMGWVTTYRTESWHRDLDLAGSHGTRGPGEAADVPAVVPLVADHHTADNGSADQSPAGGAPDEPVN